MKNHSLQQNSTIFNFTKFIISQNQPKYRPYGGVKPLDNINKDMMTKLNNNFGSSMQKIKDKLAENNIDNEGVNALDDLTNGIGTSEDYRNMKKYTDDLWNQTLSTEANDYWEGARAMPSIVWPTTSSSCLFNSSKGHSKPSTSRQANVKNDDIWSNIIGNNVNVNVFFPASTSSTAALSSAAQQSPKKLPLDTRQRRTSDDSSHHHHRVLKTPNRKKIKNNSPFNVSEFEDFDNITKKRLSLTALRNTLCRQKAVENLNNNNDNRQNHKNSNAITEIDEYLMQVGFLS